MAHLNPYTLGSHKKNKQEAKDAQGEHLAQFRLADILKDAQWVAQQPVGSVHPFSDFCPEQRNSEACISALRAFQPHIVLFAPQIPQNAGTVARMCAAFCMHLHLIRPLGFEITERAFRRPGLDYWQFVRMTIHDSWDDFVRFFGNRRYVFIETRQAKSVSEFSFLPGDMLVFGPETTGIPEPLLKGYLDTLSSNESPRGELTNSLHKETERDHNVAGPVHAAVQIPMWHPGVRSINLASTVAIVAHAALSDLSLRAQRGD